MKIVVTGSSGFIGKKLVSQLKCENHEVVEFNRNFKKVECDRIYHLACPSTTEKIKENPTQIIDIIVDKTREALNIDESALFVNASTIGVLEIENNFQGCYNIAKLCMEFYLNHINRKVINYRLPAVYGEGMHDDNFIKRCVDGRAYEPKEPNKKYYIAHIDDVIKSLIELKPVDIEETTLGKIYEQFNFGRRRIYRSTFGS